MTPSVTLAEGKASVEFAHKVEMTTTLEYTDIANRKFQEKNLVFSVVGVRYSLMLFRGNIKYEYNYRRKSRRKKMQLLAKQQSIWAQWPSQAVSNRVKLWNWPRRKIKKVLVF